MGINPKMIKVADRFKCIDSVVVQKLNWATYSHYLVMRFVDGVAIAEGVQHGGDFFIAANTTKWHLFTDWPGLKMMFDDNGWDEWQVEGFVRTVELMQRIG